MTVATVRTTITLSTDLLAAADHAIRNGLAKSRNELISLALRHELELQKRIQIDQAFAGMAEDSVFQAESIQIAEEFANADWESLQLGEQQP